MKILILSGLVLLTTSCAHQSTIIPFQKNAVTAPTNPDQVGIYRHAKPFAHFSEIGLITFRARSYDLNFIYSQLRTDAAAQGADAVVDTKIKGESHTETTTEHKCESKTTCDTNGTCSTEEVCHDEPVSQTVYTYLVEGSMIRRTK